MPYLDKRTTITAASGLALSALAAIILFILLGRCAARHIAIRESPLQIRPIIIDDEDRPSVLTFRPYDLMYPKSSIRSISHALHYLHFWGQGCTPAPAQRCAISNEAIIAALLDGKSHPRYLPAQSPLYRGADGIIRTARSGKEGGEAHPSQVLATLGAIGIPSSRPITSDADVFTVADAIRSTLDTFSLDGELEWLAITCMYYLPPEQRWQNRWGEEFTFDKVAETFLKRPLGTGSCGGTHTLYVLAAFLRANEECRILSDDVTSRIHAYLVDAASRLEQSQTATGAWTKSWPEGPPSHGSANLLLSSHIDDLMITGHHLEWILIAPYEIRPRIESVREAVMSCIRVLSATTSDDITRDTICTYTHAIRSVSIYCGSHSRCGEAVIRKPILDAASTEGR